MNYSDLAALINGRFLVRHALLTFSGTWAAPGTGYPSWVAQAANQDLVYEVPVQAPWSFGFVNSPDPNAPSYQQSVQDAVDWAVAWIQAHPFQTFILGGYSQGGEAASRVLVELQSGRLTDRTDDLIGGYTFGNPMRQAGHLYPGAADPGGAGIAPTQLTNTPVTWHDHANPGDIYTTTPLDGAGAIMRTFYTLATQLQINNPTAFAEAMIGGIVQLMRQLGGSLPLAVLGQLGGGAALAGFSGLLGGAGLPGSSLPGVGDVSIPGVGVVDAVQAAVLGIQFISTNPPTAPHITYEFTDALPGVPGYSHIAHAVDHVNQIAAATAARTAA